MGIRDMIREAFEWCANEVQKTTGESERRENSYLLLGVNSAYGYRLACYSDFLRALYSSCAIASCTF